jgi:hypothetical protein
VGAVTIGAGTRWCLHPLLPRPAALPLRFRLFEGEELLGVRQVQREAEGESSGIGIEGISAKVRYCMVCVGIWCFEYLNLARHACCENWGSHKMREIREIREGHDVKS